MDIYCAYWILLLLPNVERVVVTLWPGLTVIQSVPVAGIGMDRSVTGYDCEMCDEFTELQRLKLATPVPDL